MLKIQIVDKNISSGSIPISWCLCKETLEEVIAKVGPNPQLVIVVAPVNNYHRSKENRYVVPLAELLTYVSFKTPGPNRIWAFIALGTQKETRRSYLNNYSFVLDWDGKEWDQMPNWGTYLDVDVPAEAFASQPPAWEKAWVNHFFLDKTVDQCHYRQRRLFAYTIQPIIMIVNILLRIIVTLLALLIGSRAWSLQPLLHPLVYDLSEQWESVTSQGSYFIRKLPFPDQEMTPNQELWHLLRMLALVPFMPLILILIGLGVVIPQIGTIMVTCLLTLLAMIGVIFLFGIIIDPNLRWDFFAKLITPTRLDKTDVESLICSPDRKQVSMQTLPANKKTIKLKYLALKAKVCKPFSI